MYHSQCPVNVCVTAVVLAAKSIFQSPPTGQVVQMPCQSPVTPDFRTEPNVALLSGTVR